MSLCSACHAAEARKKDTRCLACNRIHVRERREKARREVEFLRERNTVLQAKLDEQTAELKSLRIFYRRFLMRTGRIA